MESLEERVDAFWDELETSMKQWFRERMNTLENRFPKPGERNNYSIEEDIAQAERQAWDEGEHYMLDVIEETVRRTKDALYDDTIEYFARPSVFMQQLRKELDVQEHAVVVDLLQKNLGLVRESWDTERYRNTKIGTATHPGETIDLDGLLEQFCNERRHEASEFRPGELFWDALEQEEYEEARQALEAVRLQRRDVDHPGLEGEIYNMQVELAADTGDVPLWIEAYQSVHELAEAEDVELLYRDNSYVVGNMERLLENGVFEQIRIDSPRPLTDEERVNIAGSYIRQVSRKLAASIQEAEELSEKTFYQRLGKSMDYAKRTVEQFSPVRVRIMPHLAEQE